MSDKREATLHEFLADCAPWQKKQLMDKVGCTATYLYHCVCGSNRPRRLHRRAFIEYSQNHNVNNMILTEYSILLGYVHLDTKDGKITKRRTAYEGQGVVVDEGSNVVSQ